MALNLSAFQQPTKVTSDLNLSAFGIKKEEPQKIEELSQIKESPQMLFKPDLFATKTTTPQIDVSAFAPKRESFFAPRPDVVEVRDFIRELPGAVKETAKNIGQSIVRSFLTAGQTVADIPKIVSKVADKPEGTLFEDIKKAIKEIEFRPEGKIQQALAGTDKPISFESIGKETLSIFGEDFVEKHKELSFPIGLFIAGLDITQFGGTKKGAFLAFKEANTVGDALGVLRKMGVADDLARQFAEEVVKVTDDKAAEKLFHHIANIQQTTKVTPRVPTINVEDLPTQVTTKGVETKKIIRETTGQIKDELRAFNQRIRDLARGAREGAVATKRRIELEQKQASIEERFLNSLTKDIQKAIEVPKGKERSRISFIKEFGEFKQTAIVDAKRGLGIEKPIREMNLEELASLATEMKGRLAFKRERGFAPTGETLEKLNIIPKETPPPAFTPEFYKTNRVIQEATKPTFKARIVEKVSDIGKGADKILTPLSTRFQNISPQLKTRLRKYRFDTRQLQNADSRTLQPFLSKKKKFSKEDFVDFDLAAKNGDTLKINELAKKYGMESELSNLRITLDNLYKRAKEVGYDIGYRTEYFPRTIRNIDGFMDYFRKSADWGFFNEGIRKKEMELGRYLTEEEKAHMINSMVRGYKGGNITLSRAGAMKERLINVITPELNQFYDSVDDSLLHYINEVNNKIEAAKFFGKNGTIKDSKGIPTNLNDSIGAFLADELATGRIDPQQELELRELLQTLFNPKGTSGIVGVFKDLGYIDTLGDFRAAITQLGDLGLSMYSAGAGKGLLEATRSLLGKSKITKEMLGFATEEISAEFSKKSTTRQALDMVLRLVGFNKMDRMGAEALVNGTISRMRQRVLEGDALLRKELEEMFPTRLFPEGTVDNVIESLKAGEITDDVKFLGFNKLLDFTPRDIIEMPEQYIKGGNGRIFYMLKSWTIKLFDVYRREVFEQIKENPKDGLKNFMRLTGFLLVMNATADEIKDFISGRKTEFSDRVVDSIAKLAGFSRYTLFQAEREGLGSAILQQLLPPTPTIDDVSKDVIGLYSDADKSFSINELRSIKSIPIGGDLYYWWFGKGVKAREEQAQKTSVPSINIPSINIPSVAIPSISL